MYRRCAKADIAYEPRGKVNIFTGIEVGALISG